MARFRGQFLFGYHGLWTWVRQTAFVEIGLYISACSNIIEDLNIHSGRAQEFTNSDRDKLITDPAHRQSQ